MPRKKWTAADVEAVERGGRARDAVIKRMRRANLGTNGDDKLTIEELTYFNQAARVVIRDRARTFEKKGEYSYALEAYKTTMNRPGTYSNSKNESLKEATASQAFFRAQTSNLAGVRRVNKAQDARIFGQTKPGEPQSHLTVDERRRFWEFYDKFTKNNEPNKGEESTVLQTWIQRNAAYNTALLKEEETTEDTRNRFNAEINRAIFRWDIVRGNTHQEFDPETNIPLSRQEMFEKYFPDGDVSGLSLEELNAITDWLGKDVTEEYGLQT